MNVEFKELENGQVILGIREYNEMFESNRTMKQKLQILEEMFREEVKETYEIAERRFNSETEGWSKDNPFYVAGISLKKIAALINQQIYLDNFTNKAEDLKRTYLEAKKGE